MSYAINVSVKNPQQKNDVCLTDLQNRFDLTGNRFQRQVQQLIVSLEEILNLNNSFTNNEKLFSVFNR